MPFDAVKGFFDPSVQFGLQFETVTEEKEADGGRGRPPPKTKRRSVAQEISETPAAPIGPAATGQGRAGESRGCEDRGREGGGRGEGDDKPDKPAGGAEVVRLDRFRKK